MVGAAGSRRRRVAMKDLRRRGGTGVEIVEYEHECEDEDGGMQGDGRQGNVKRFYATSYES